MLQSLYHPIRMVRRRGFLRAFAAVVTALASLSSFAAAASLEQIYFAENGTGKISQMNPDGTNVVPVIQGLPSPNQVAVDPTEKKLYFSTSGDGTLRRANLDGTNVETLATSQGTIVSIQLDLAERRIYWLSGGGPVRRANLDGTSPQTIIANTQFGDGLAIDLLNAKLYYSSRNQQAIIRTDLDGTNPENVVTGVQLSPSLAVNSATNELFYGSYQNNPGVFRVNLGTATLPVDHGAAVPLSTAGSFAVTLDASAGHVYFSTGSNLFRADLDGSNVVIVTFGRQGLLGAALLPRVNRVVATLGQAAPGIAGTTLRSFGQPVVNASGQVAFDSVLASTNGAVSKENDRALWSTLGSGNLTLVARENGPTGITGVNFKSWSALHIANGILVFRAKLAGSNVTSANDDAICAWDGSSIRFIAREGETADDVTWGTFGHPSINDRGQVSFLANYTISGARGNGLFVTDPNGGDLTSLVTRGGTIDLDGEEVTVSRITHRAVNAGGRLLSSTGYIATCLKLSDGRTVVAVLAE